MASSFKYDDAGWREFQARADSLAGIFVRVGVLSDKGGSQQHGEGDPITMLELAAIHEFGSPAANIPERSFIRRTFTFKNIGYDEITTRLVRAVTRGKITARAALELLGQWGVAQVRKTITGDEHIPPPLEPATIEAKGSDRPLVDTGRLLNAIAYQVSTSSKEAEGE